LLEICPSFYVAWLGFQPYLSVVGNRACHTQSAARPEQGFFCIPFALAPFRCLLRSRPPYPYRSPTASVPLISQSVEFASPLLRAGHHHHIIVPDKHMAAAPHATGIGGSAVMVGGAFSSTSATAPLFAGSSGGVGPRPALGAASHETTASIEDRIPKDERVSDLASVRGDHQLKRHL